MVPVRKSANATHPRTRPNQVCSQSMRCVKLFFSMIGLLNAPRLLRCVLSTTVRPDVRETDGSYVIADPRSPPIVVPA